MQKLLTRWSVGLTAMLTVGALCVTASPASATSIRQRSACSISSQKVQSSAASIGVGGISFASSSGSTANCQSSASGPAYNGTPPLLFHGSLSNCFYEPCVDGDMMMTASTGPLTVVPIFWAPARYSMTLAYKQIITRYLHDVAAASGRTNNVFSVLNQYGGNNGQIGYNMKLGPVLSDTDPIESGCTVAPADRTGIYADGTGYSACVDDAQLQAEVDKVSAANGLPHDLSHIYVLYLPKHVESCFLPGSSTSTAGGQACTINYEPTAAYCAYHSDDTNSAVYANMAYPIYASPVGYTCGSDAVFSTVQTPNSNADADTEISPTSHEISESITDPDTETGWYDSTGNEVGDDCAYIYGATRGTSGAYYNQVINGGHFLTQEEFSNSLFASSDGQAGCAQGSAP